MSRGLPYDSDAGRDYAAAITALMTGEAYAQSARVARDHGGPFAGYERNREPFLRVMRKHREAIKDITARHVPADLYNAAKQSWDDAVELGEDFGYRNAQATVLAPTGTIGFMMDCDTTGVEPDIALVKYKLLAGGGMLKIVNRGVPDALRRLGYSAAEIEKIIAHVEKYDTIEDVVETIDDQPATIHSGLKPEHLAVFDCAFKAHRGQRSISYTAHLKMMGAAQPFISGAISKTVNMPNAATAEEIRSANVDAWKMGLKCVAIYRDGSKRSQPLNTKKTNEGGSKVDPAVAEKVVEQLENKIGDLQAEVARLAAQPTQPLRRRLSDTRHAINHKFEIAGHEGYLTVGLFEDGRPGELFVTMAKEGSTIGGLMDTIGALTSMALQYGVPLEGLVKKFAHQRFEPSGFTKNPDIRNASSIIDYVFRWMGCQFVPGYKENTAPKLPQPDLPLAGLADVEKISVNRTSQELPPTGGTDIINLRATVKLGNGHGAAALTASFVNQLDAPACPSCGSVTVRNGACYKCLNCGESLGCS
jgi:ribonucleoside-diphosphate reductase alpha chain